MVPLSWAGSIIVSESTDPTDYYDGFGTSEMVIGIRAYQWGWEYYYPKNADINYGVRPNYSTFTGNSLKYNKASSSTTDGNALWKFYQNNLTDGVITPAHLLVLPNDNVKVLNHLNFNDIGANTLKESQAFKKIRQSSKTFTTNLVLTPGTFVGKYNTLHDLYLRDSSLTDSLNYGNSRQHNLTATLASINTNRVALDTPSSVKFITQTLGVAGSKTVKEGQSIDLASSWNDTTNKNESVSTKVSVIGSFKPKTATTSYVNSSVAGQTTPVSVEELQSVATPSNPTSFTTTTTDTQFLNNTYTTKSSTNNAALTQLSPANQNIRALSELPLNKPSVNFNTQGKSVNHVPYSHLSGLPGTWYTNNAANNLDVHTTSRLLSNRTNVNFAASPMLSNNPFADTTGFDTWQTKQSSFHFSGRDLAAKFNTDHETSEVGSTSSHPSRLYTGGDINALVALRSPYWSMFWGRSNPDLRIKAGLDAQNLHRFFYLQEPVDYAEYDFRNAQAADLFEEAIWESSYSAYNHQDYIDLLSNYRESAYAPKVTQQPIAFFYPKQFNFSIDAEPSLESYLRDTSNLGTFYTNSIFFDDYILPLNLSTTKAFSLTSNIAGLDAMEDSTSGTKGLLSLVEKSGRSGLNSSSIFPTTTSTLDTLNAFRADFEDYTWASDFNLMETNNNVLALLHRTYFNFGSLENLIQLDTDLTNNTPRNAAQISDNLVLRSSARNSILSYNALQKVFRSRFEEGRAHVSPLHYSETFVKKPNLSSPRANVEGMLGKNKTSFFTSVFFKTDRLPLLNELYGLTSSLNFQTYDFPFLLAETSDPAKFLWLDWRAKWGRKEVQPALTARLSLLASPHTRKHFDYNVDDLDGLQRWDFYTLRLARARKNYLTNWAYSPSVFLKNHAWFTQDQTLQSFYTTLQSGPQTLLVTTHLMDLMEMFWATTTLYSNSTPYFTPSSSGVTSYSHSENSYTVDPISSYAVNTANLIDYLTKREYLYRQLSTSYGGSTYVPRGLTAGPNNPLVHLFKTSYNFADPINTSSEGLRNNWGAVNVRHPNTLTTLVSDNIFVQVEKAFAALSNTLDMSANRTGSDYMLKSQFKPLKKGISNMLRLHATGTIAMPIEMRLQILASSRDIIHSWAVPGAGIKIDCVPGYTSHRTAIFLVSGIYWGQCMEICGRYHHWMPIVVQFMKRDLFFLWCTHFISQPNKSSGWDITDRQHVNFIRLASFDKNTWADESVL